MRSAGNLQEADRFHRDSLSTIESTLGPDNPDADRLRKKLQMLDKN
jgi:hypothetical protein